MAKVKVGDSVALKGYPDRYEWMHKLAGMEAEILDIWKVARGDQEATILKLDFAGGDPVYISSRYVKTWTPPEKEEEVTT